MAPTLSSNSLADLAERIRVTEEERADAERTAVGKAIEAGKLLLEAKQSCQHGEWLPFLERANMPERKAQRYMQLARIGLKPDTVSDLGGIKATLQWAEGLRLPSAGEFLIVALNLNSPHREPLSLVWRENGGYRFCVLDLREPIEHELATREGEDLKLYIEKVKEAPFIDVLTKPIVVEAAVLPAVYARLEHRYSEMSFVVCGSNAFVGALQELAA